jgi:hypothetical protein
MTTREEEIAWAAGLFEGEGSITQRGGMMVASLKSTDEETPLRFCRIVRGGTVYGPGPYRNKSADGFRRKPFWVWVAESVDLLETLRLVLPWLGIHRTM